MDAACRLDLGRRPGAGVTFVAAHRDHDERMCVTAPHTRATAPSRSPLTHARILPARTWPVTAAATPDRRTVDGVRRYDATQLCDRPTQAAVAAGGQQRGGACACGRAESVEALLLERMARRQCRCAAAATASLSRRRRRAPLARAPSRKHPPCSGSHRAISESCPAVMNTPLRSHGGLRRHSLALWSAL